MELILPPGSENDPFTRLSGPQWLRSMFGALPPPRFHEAYTPPPDGDQDRIENHCAPGSPDEGRTYQTHVHGRGPGQAETQIPKSVLTRTGSVVGVQLANGVVLADGTNLYHRDIVVTEFFHAPPLVVVRAPDRILFKRLHGIDGIVLSVGRQDAWLTL